MSAQAQVADPRGWTIHRNRRGWPRWYQRWLEAWWILTGRWSLHSAWQDGITHGSRMEYERIIINGGSLVPLSRKIVDLTWGRAMEDGSVPSSKISFEIIARAWNELRARPMVAEDGVGK